MYCKNPPTSTHTHRPAIKLAVGDDTPWCWANAETRYPAAPRCAAARLEETTDPGNAMPTALETIITATAQALDGSSMKVAAPPNASITVIVTAMGCHAKNKTELASMVTKTWSCVIIAILPPF